MSVKGGLVERGRPKCGKGMHVDLAGERGRGKGAGAVAMCVWSRGPGGPACIRQYEQAGLRGVSPLYTVFTVDALSLGRLQKAKLGGVLGSWNTMFWADMKSLNSASR